MKTSNWDNLFPSCFSYTNNQKNPRIKSNTNVITDGSKMINISEVQRFQRRDHSCSSPVIYKHVHFKLTHWATLLNSRLSQMIVWNWPHKVRISWLVSVMFFCKIVQQYQQLQSFAYYLTLLNGHDVPWNWRRSFVCQAGKDKQPTKIKCPKTWRIERSFMSVYSLSTREWQLQCIIVNRKMFHFDN